MDIKQLIFHILVHLTIPLLNQIVPTILLPVSNSLQTHNYNYRVTKPAFAIYPTDYFPQSSNQLK